jgi:hypothetical protein
MVCKFLFQKGVEPKMARKLNTPKTEEPVVKAAAPAKAPAPKRHKKATPAIAETETISTPSPSLEASLEAGATESTPEFTLDPQEVSRLAHSYWVARNYQPGSQVADWFRAENELRTRAAARF